MRKVTLILITLTLAVATYAQSYKSERFKQELRTIAGSDQVDSTDFDSVSRINAGFERKAFIKNLNPRKQLALWQNHYAYVLATFPLTPEQEALVREGARKFLTVDFFIKMSDPNFRDSPKQQELNEYYNRVKQVFTPYPELYRNIFELPGTVAPEIVSQCELKGKAERNAMVRYEGLIQPAKVVLKKVDDELAGCDPRYKTCANMIDCSCNWAAGCSSWSCNGTRCKEVINCGPFGGSTCEYACS